MMKNSAKRRRSKAQIKEDKAREEQQKLDIQAKMMQWDDLTKELE